MNGRDLINGLSFVDESFIYEADTKRVDRNHRFTWQKAIILVAGFAIAVFSGTLLFKYSDTPIADDEKVISSQEENQSEAVSDQYAFSLNRATDNVERRIYIEGHFWQELSEKELQGVFNQVADNYEVVATANFSKTENEIKLYNVVGTISIAEGLTANVTVSPNKIDKCYVLDREPILSEINGVAIDAGYFDKTNNGEIIYYADFEVNGVYYYVEMTGGKAEKAAMPALVNDIICGEKADFSVITPKPPEQLLNDTLTLDEAQIDKDFGEFIPKSFKSGYSLNAARRFVNQSQNYLLVSLSNGHSEIDWMVSYINDADRKRITSVEDTKNYNLELYPIPTFESVPEELSEIVDNPIFLIEELTLDTVKMRSRIVEDSGDISGERIGFSVLFGETLIEIHTKGVLSKDVYEMLMSLK